MVIINGSAPVIIEHTFCTFLLLGLNCLCSLLAMYSKVEILSQAIPFDDDKKYVKQDIYRTGFEAFFYSTGQLKSLQSLGS